MSWKHRDSQLLSFRNREWRFMLGISLVHSSLLTMCLKTLFCNETGKRKKLDHFILRFSNPSILSSCLPRSRVHYLVYSFRSCVLIAFYFWNCSTSQSCVCIKIPGKTSLLSSEIIFALAFHMANAWQVASIVLAHLTHKRLNHFFYIAWLECS